MSEQITPQQGWGTATTTQPAPPKKKRRIFLWVFLAVQILFIVWIIAGIASNGGHATNCGTLSQTDCDNAKNVGKGLGVAIIVVFWIVVDFLLAVVYGVYRLARRT